MPGSPSAKANGGARVCGYDPNMQSRVTERLDVENELRQGGVSGVL